MAQEIALTSPDREVKTIDLTWKSLYQIGGSAALICAVMYLITLGVYIPANLEGPPPETVLEWFMVFEESSITGLFFLGLGDVVIMILWGPVALALYVVLRRANKTWALIAARYIERSGDTVSGAAASTIRRASLRSVSRWSCVTICCTAGTTHSTADSPGFCARYTMSGWNQK